MEFKAWPKITRIEKRRAPIFTEKLDGTNACIVISDTLELFCQSRSRFITPEDDNFGFARWAYERKEDLLKLGPGYHYGEWWGSGIQRTYDLQEKRFSLFNTQWWNDNNPHRPECCHVVPRLPVETIEQAKQFLLENGSLAAPGYMRVEGAIMYEPDTDTCFKIILDK